MCLWVETSSIIIIHNEFNFMINPNNDAVIVEYNNDLFWVISVSFSGLAKCGRNPAAKDLWPGLTSWCHALTTHLHRWCGHGPGGIPRYSGRCSLQQCCNKSPGHRCKGWPDTHPPLETQTGVWGRKQSSSFSTDKQWFSLKVWKSLNSRQRQNKENWLLTVEARNNYLLYYVYLWCCFLSVFLYFPNLSVCLRLGMKKNVSKVRIFDSHI